MPLSKYLISQPFFYGHPDFYHQYDEATLLQDVSMAQITGALHQLGYLASYAAEMFDGLFRISEDTMEGIKAVTARTTKLMQKIEAVEKKIAEAPLKTAPDRPRKFRPPEPVFMLITKHTLPPQLAKKYAQAELPPPLWMFDAHREDNGRCLQEYSYPGFFFREWFNAEAERQRIQRQLRKKEKQRRKFLRDERKMQRRSVKAENLKRLNWMDRYEAPQTGNADDTMFRDSAMSESMGHFIRQSERTSTLRGSTLAGRRGGRRSSVVADPAMMAMPTIEPMQPPPFPTQELPALEETKADFPPPRETAISSHHHHEHKAEIAWDDTTITTQFTEHNTIVEVDDSYEEPEEEPEPEGWHQAYDQMGRPYYYNIQTKETSWVYPDAPAAPPMPQYMLTAPVAPMLITARERSHTQATASEPDGPNLQADLLMQIRTGKKLRNVEVAPRPILPKLSLLDAIKKFEKSGGLKKAEPIQKVTHEQRDDAVARILANRGAIAGNSDSSDSDDSDDSDFF